MRIFNVYDDNARSLQELASARRRVLVVDYDNVMTSSGAPTNVLYPTIPELLDCVMTTTRTRVVLITRRQAEELASDTPGPSPDIWETIGPRGPDTILPAMLANLENDGAVAFLCDGERFLTAEAADETPAVQGHAGADRQAFVQFLVDWLRICGGEIC
jgi:hypothetical protein